MLKRINQAMEESQERAKIWLYPELKAFGTIEERKLALELCDARGVGTTLLILLTYSLTVAWIWVHGQIIRPFLVSKGVPRAVVFVLAVVVLLALCFIAMVPILRRERRIVRSKLQRLLRLEGKAICAKCHYDLTGNTTGICPECGTPAPRPLPPPS